MGTKIFNINCETFYIGLDKASGEIHEQPNNIADNFVEEYTESKVGPTGCLSCNTKSCQEPPK